MPIATEISRRWRAALADDFSRRVARNLTYLFSANAIVTGANIVILAVTARALGPVGLGILALVESYVRAVDLFLRFETGQAVLKYGTEALERNRPVVFRRAIKFSLLCDLAGGCFAALVAILAAGAAAGFLNFDAGQQTMLVAFAATLVFSVSSTAVAVLQLFDRFDMLARTTVVLSIVRLIIAAGIWFFSGGLWAFVTLLMISQVADHLVPLVLALRELQRQGHGDFWKVPLNGVTRENAGLFAFIFNANLNVVARNSTLRFDTLIVGGLLGPASAGFYQLAKRVGLLATKISKPVQQTIYPEIARLWARGEIARFRRVVFGINFLLLSITVLALAFLWFFGEPLIRFFFGNSFAPATPLVIVQAIAAALFFSGSIFSPALLSMGEDSALVRVTLLGSFGSFILVPAVRMFDALGASMAHVLFNITLVFGCLRLFLHHTREAARNAVVTSVRMAFPLGPHSRRGPLLLCE